LLFSEAVTITFTTVSTLMITLNNETSGPYAAKVSDFSFTPIR
jgi:hypothetical protein